MPAKPPDFDTCFRGFHTTDPAVVNYGDYKPITCEDNDCDEDVAHE